MRNLPALTVCGHLPDIVEASQATHWGRQLSSPLAHPIEHSGEAVG